jgi:hypothetical protein
MTNQNNPYLLSRPTNNAAHAELESSGDDYTQAIFDENQEFMAPPP